jgi:hypothetical protein
MAMCSRSFAESSKPTIEFESDMHYWLNIDSGFAITCRQMSRKSEREQNQQGDDSEQELQMKNA